MKKIIFPRLQLIAWNIKNNIKLAFKPEQLEDVLSDVSSLPEYQRQVEFLKKYNIQKPYDCMQCERFDIELDSCNTKYSKVYGYSPKQDRMCPGFNPPKEGCFCWGEPIILSGCEGLLKNK